MKTKTQICIIDDEKHGRDYIALLVKKEFPDFEIIFQASNIEDSYKNLLKNIPDIIFLDIQLRENTAFDLLSNFKELPSQIIFVTAYENFAIQAIRNGVTDYLLKPIKKIDFIVAVNKALENIKKVQPAQINPLQDHKVILSTLQGFKIINIADIVRCEADSSYTTFYLTNKTKIMVSKTLHEFELVLPDLNFFRIHHKHLINLDHLQEYVKGRGGQVVMSDGSVLDVSFRRKNDFLHKIGNTD
ncbi:response regulator [Chryseobacterium sp. L7]|uniref:Response regulator n=1 Tax=Chryseobacterium endalhagicum TaxID=2797638 RepID=A0ABS1QDL4_9FLAO|nr:LytTR family transcriptional regulator DNA-binding domain-containing protein [Chryseobacterium endalhagicum]MBL1220701.1 response regulator [Chryseobacterium endalhagicum]